MYINFKKLFVSLIFLKSFLLPVYAMDVDSGASGSGSVSAAAPMASQDSLEDPRMHVTSVQLVENEDGWLNDVKHMVVAQKGALEEDRNTVFMRFGFLVQKEGSPAQLIFPPELADELSRTCFISGFQHVDPKDGVIFCSLKDLFPNDRYPDWTTYRRTLRGIIGLRLGRDAHQINIAEEIKQRDRIETKLNFYDVLLSSQDPEKIKVEMLSKIPRYLEEIRKSVSENPIEFVQERKLEEQKSLDNQNMRISDLRRLMDIENADWGKKFCKCSRPLIVRRQIFSYGHLKGIH